MTTDETMTEIVRLIEHGDLDAAEKQLSALASGNQSSPKWWLLKGRIETRQGQLQLGTESLEKAIELDPHDPDALFSLAFVCDLHGDDERAVELYQQCVRTPPMRVNAMINLAVIYEDRGHYEEAESCLRQVLKSYPNHKRATLFLKDVLSSQDMYYDEDLERTREEHDAVLDIPISDFELSVAEGKADRVTPQGGKEVHAADVARAVGVLLKADGVAGQAYNCYDRYISHEEVAEVAVRLSGRDVTIARTNPGPKHQIDTSKIRKLGMTFGGEALLETTVGELLNS